jgi:hypothetical protein
MDSLDEWCDAKRYILTNDKIQRCEACGRRLKPQEYGGPDTIFYRLPPHKKKGYKINRKKGHNKRKENNGKNTRRRS